MGRVSIPMRYGTTASGHLAGYVCDVLNSQNTDRRMTHSGPKSRIGS